MILNKAKLFWTCAKGCFGIVQKRLSSSEFSFDPCSKHYDPTNIFWPGSKSFWTYKRTLQMLLVNLFYASEPKKAF